MLKKLFVPISLIMWAGLGLIACNGAAITPRIVVSTFTAGPTLTTLATSPITSAPKPAPALISGPTSIERPAIAPSGTLEVPAEVTRTVFLIVMENTNWSDIKGSGDAPYLNTMLLPMAAYASQYYNPPNLHPSEPNYLWLEAGTNFGVANDKNPDANHQSTSMHLVTLLNQKGISWRSYQEDISGTDCPLVREGLYAPKHNPMIFFDDVTGANNPSSTYCISHVRPFSELTTDLQHNTAARYNFITPNLCDDMHGNSRCTSSNRIQKGDDWLANHVPDILNSPAYANGGVLFITWDEGEGGDGPIGLMVLSATAKGGGYSNSIHYTHSSLLRTIQEIFGVTPLLGDAAQASNLSDLFVTFP